MLLFYFCLFASVVQAYDVSRTLSSTHWNPCYQNPALSSLPSLHNGAATLSRLGTSAIKVALFQPGWMYPWNSTWNVENMTNLVHVLSHPYFTSLFSNTIPSYPTNFSVFSLIAYSCSGNASTGQACNVTNSPQGTNYWCSQGVSAADAARETAQFNDATLYLLTTYANSGKRFMFDNWEGDWSMLCGSWSRTQPVSPFVSAAMVAWLTARQAGVSNARRAYCHQHLSSLLDCSSVPERDILRAAGVEVYMGAEVNLVGASLPPSPTPWGKTYMVRTVLPNVSLDLISYSSYDTQAGPQFAQALDFIAAQHRPTSATPLDDSPVYVAEFGTAQMRSSPAQTQAVVKNVISVAFSKGNNPNGLRRASHVFWWELFCNEDNCRDGQPGRCVCRGVCFLL